MVETITNKEDPPFVPRPPPNLPKFEPVTPATYAPERDLLVTRAVRGAVMDELVREKIPTDPKEIAALLAVLKDQDSQSLGIIRARIEKDANDLSSEAVALSREILHGMKGADPTKLAYTVLNATNEAPQLSDDVVTRDLVPGEMEKGATHGTIEEFKKQVGADIQFAETDKEDE